MQFKWLLWGAGFDDCTKLRSTEVIVKLSHTF